VALAPGLWIFVREWHQIVVFDNGVPFAIGILLSVFLTWHPGRALLRQDSRPAPWWWDIAVYATFAMMIFAFYIDHAYPYIGVAPFPWTVVGLVQAGYPQAGADSAALARGRDCLWVTGRGTAFVSS